MLAHLKARPINHIIYLLLFLIKQQKVILSKLTEHLLLLVHRRILTRTFRGPANCTLDQPYVSTKLDPQGWLQQGGAANTARGNVLLVVGDVFETMLV